MSFPRLGAIDIGPIVGVPVIARDQQGHRSNMANLVRWARGKLSAHVHAVYPLAKTADALTAIADRKVMGKVIELVRRRRVRH